MCSREEPLKRARYTATASRNRSANGAGRWEDAEVSSVKFFMSRQRGSAFRSQNMRLMPQAQLALTSRVLYRAAHGQGSASAGSTETGRVDREQAVGFTPGARQGRPAAHLGEPFGCPDRPAAGLQAEPGADAPACPPFDEFFQPGLGDAIEPQPLTAAEAEVVQPPDVAAVLGVPAFPGVGQVLELAAGEDEQGPRVGVLGGLGRSADAIGLQANRAAMSPGSRPGTAPPA